MAVYLIAQILIHDRAEYDKYEAGFMDVWEKFDGKLLSVDDEPRVLEGEFEATRSVLLEFPTKEAAFAWAASDEYQAIAKHRHAASITNSIMVKSGAPQLSKDASDT